MILYQRYALRIIHQTLQAKNWSVATAESLTAGLISATLASQKGASAYLRGGIAAYTLDAKVDLLGVDRGIAQDCNCVSPEVAMQMALGVKARLHTECSIAVTGYAEAPETSSVGPFAHYAVICDKKMSTGVIYGGNRDRNAMRQWVVTSTLCELATLLDAL